jgi:hypothetical protein
MSAKTDDSSLEIDFSEVTERGKARLFKALFEKVRNSQQMAHKRSASSDDVDDYEDDETELEMVKNSKLAMEKKGAPAPVTATESDFPKGDVRRALKRMPKSAIKKKRG